VADTALVLAAIAAPWWLVAVLASIAAFYFRRWAELVAIGIILDSLYNGPAGWFGGFPYTMTLVAIVTLLVIEYLKTFLRTS